MKPLSKKALKKLASRKDSQLLIKVVGTTAYGPKCSSTKEAADTFRHMFCLLETFTGDRT